MKKTIDCIGMLLLIATLSVSVSSCSKEQAAQQQPAPAQTALPEETKKDVQAARETEAARVNGVEITMYELVREMNRIAPKHRSDKNASAEPTRVIRKEALNRLIFKELAVQEAVKQGITVSPETIDQVIELMKKQMGDGEYRKYLEESDITEAGLRNRIERSHLVEMITAKAVYAKVTVDDKDARADYEAHAKEYRDGGGRLLSYDEAAPLIRRKLIAQKGADRMRAWEKLLRKNAKIVLARAG